MDEAPVIAGLVLEVSGSFARSPTPVRGSNKSSWTGSEGVVEDALASRSGCSRSLFLPFEFPVMLILEGMPIRFPAKRRGAAIVECFGNQGARRPSAVRAALHKVEEISQLHVWARRPEVIRWNQAAPSGALDDMIGDAERDGSVQKRPRLFELVKGLLLAKSRTSRTAIFEPRRFSLVQCRISNGATIKTSFAGPCTGFISRTLAPFLPVQSFPQRIRSCLDAKVLQRVDNGEEI
jgi:hypothetical protein